MVPVILIMAGALTLAFAHSLPKEIDPEEYEEFERMELTAIKQAFLLHLSSLNQDAIERLFDATIIEQEEHWLLIEYTIKLVEFYPHQFPGVEISHGAVVEFAWLHRETVKRNIRKHEAVYI